jgi:hypothetical protein
MSAILDSALDAVRLADCIRNDIAMGLITAPPVEMDDTDCSCCACPGRCHFGGDAMSHPICRECETCVWCARNGCIPKVSEPAKPGTCSTCGNGPCRTPEACGIPIPEPTKPAKSGRDWLFDLIVSAIAITALVYAFTPI